MTGLLHPNDPIDYRNPQTRYKYTPVHQDVAVCCVPNAGRIYPYYVKSMWMRTNNGFLAALYGACELNTNINGVAVRITEQTNYPFDLTISFSIDVSQPVEFELVFRKPAWASGFELQTTGKWREEEGFIKIHKLWQIEEKIVLCFQTKVKVNEFRNDECFLSYGSLVFALPLKGRVEKGKNYPLEGFRDLYYSLEEPSVVDFSSIKEIDFTLENQSFNEENPWETAIVLRQPVSSLRLIPLGGIILRQVTFHQLHKD